MKNKEKNEKRIRKTEKELNLDLVVPGWKSCRWYLELWKLCRRYSELRKSCRWYLAYNRILCLVHWLQWVFWAVLGLQWNIMPGTLPMMVDCWQYLAYNGSIIVGTKAMTDGMDVVPRWYIGYGWLSAPKIIAVQRLQLATKLP